MKINDIVEAQRKRKPRQLDRSVPKPPAEPGRTEHPFKGLLVGDSVERYGDQLDEGARIQHAEDVVFWEGSKGAARALEGLRNMGDKGSKDVSIKFDGSPAIIFGRDEVSGEFVLTDKSGFGAKGYDGKAKSGRELQKMLVNRKTSKGMEVPPSYKQFAGKMRKIFDAYEKAVPLDHSGYFKGDLLYFDKPDLVDGNWVFTPNIVTYTVDANSDIGKRIARSTSGVVIHNEVNEDGVESPLTIDANDYFLSNEVLVFPPVLIQKPPKVKDDSIRDLKALINKSAGPIDSLLNRDKLLELKIADLPAVFYTYTNKKVDTGMQNLGRDFLKWLSTSKVSAPKQKRMAEYIDQNMAGFKALWQVVAGIQSVKDDIINQLDSQDADVKASIGDTPGGEGYVLSHPEGAIKLVNRAGFTAANRAIAR